MRSAAFLIALAVAGGAKAAPAGYFDLTAGVTLETGDTWTSNGERFRLYGIQSCLRGTDYTDADGRSHDCGDASLAMLAAFIKDTKPICASVARTGGLSYVVCYASVAGQRLDLANMLVTSGYAFAALNEKGMPYHLPYSVSEQLAQRKKAGLWQFKDVRHPAILLSRAANHRGKGNGQ
ncbi:thermonuclease family protein [Rhizobium sp.]|uniref:thermonuclease family protein n=1 Tax=Rhizobium sp. TaxID=391 RepID=UPI00289A4CCB